MQIAYLIGTRPDTIRSARLVSLMASDPDIELTLISAGQHYDWNMLRGFLQELDLPPLDIELSPLIGHPATQTGMWIQAIGQSLVDRAPDVLCVFGDTNSALAGAIASARVDIPVAHIEAGCRSYDMSMPEEVNRRLIDHMAAHLFPVSSVGERNLLREGVLGQIEIVGDPLFDVFKMRTSPDQTVHDRSERIGIVTLHRPANVDNAETLASILSQLDDAAEQTGLHWIFPVHPRTRQTLDAAALRNFTLRDPLLYDDFRTTLARSEVCVTDSGGVQKEALWTQVPCVTVRTSTEWPETIEQHANVLASPHSDIVEAVVRSLEPAERDFGNPYGDGQSCERIIDALKRWRATRSPSSADLSHGVRGLFRR